MVDGKKLWVVAQYELAEASRSRLLIAALTMFAAGAALSSFVFLKAVIAAEGAARSALSTQLGLDASQVPVGIVQDRALPMLASFIGDEAIRRQILQMPLLSVFYGYMALHFVAPWVLLVSTGTWAQDRASGASRFVLFRCDRLTWALGKLLGQEAVLGAGLAVGAVFAFAVESYISGQFLPLNLVWLFRTSFRAWIYANVYLGLFGGLSLFCASPLKARALALFAWLGLGLGHTLVGASSGSESRGVRTFLLWLFPAEHRAALWSPDWGSYAVAVAALLSMGGLAFFLGYSAFERSDA